MPLHEPNPRLERVQFQLRAAGLTAKASHSLDSGTHTRGYLPHVKREGARYFVTFRLNDSLPKAVLLQLQAERAERLRVSNRRRKGRAGGIDQLRKFLRTLNEITSAR